ncbi:di-N-acetylchitobiase-like [Lissotriton helveticus]
MFIMARTLLVGCWVICLVLAVASRRVRATSAAAVCPCADPKLCEPITEVRNQEVFAFDVGGKDWRFYDWTMITTIATFGDYDPELMCYAHSKRARVVVKGNVGLKDMIDPGNRTAWIAQQLDQAKKMHLDGINLDIEEDVRLYSPEYNALTALVQETAEAFHKEIQGSQVSFDGTWSPRGAVGRCYNYSAIANACDYLFVMSYDMWYSVGVAGANSPYKEALAGYEDYINLGIDQKKLVMGVPWYGYDYVCHSLYKERVCTIKLTSHYKSKVGNQVCYKTLMKQVNGSLTGRLWDDGVKSPYFDYKDTTGSLHQVWYDDPQSVSMKALYVKERGLGGIGMWDADCLDYSDDPEAVQQTKDMWKALRPYQ